MGALLALILAAALASAYYLMAQPEGRESLAPPAAVETDAAPLATPPPIETPVPGATPSPTPLPERTPLPPPVEVPDPTPTATPTPTPTPTPAPTPAPAPPPAEVREGVLRVLLGDSAEPAALFYYELWAVRRRGGEVVLRTLVRSGRAQSLTGEVAFNSPAGELEILVRETAYDGSMGPRLARVLVDAGDSADLLTARLRPGTTVVGTVLDGTNGIGVPGARVLLAPAGTLGDDPDPGPFQPPVLLTDEEGVFTRESLAPGPWVLRIQHPGHEPAERAFVIEPGRPEPPMQIPLTRR